MDAKELTNYLNQMDQKIAYRVALMHIDSLFNLHVDNPKFLNEQIKGIIERFKAQGYKL